MFVGRLSVGSSALLCGKAHYWTVVVTAVLFASLAMAEQQPGARRNVLAVLDHQLREETLLTGYRFRLEVVSAMAELDPTLMPRLAGIGGAYRAAWEARTAAVVRLQKLVSLIRQAERHSQNSLTRAAAHDPTITSLKLRLDAQFSPDEFAHLQRQLQHTQNAAAAILEQLARAHAQARNANQQLAALLQSVDAGQLPEQLRIAAIRADYNAHLEALERQLSMQRARHEEQVQLLHHWWQEQQAAIGNAQTAIDAAAKSYESLRQRAFALEGAVAAQQTAQGMTEGTATERSAVEQSHTGPLGLLRAERAEAIAAAVAAASALEQAQDDGRRLVDTVRVERGARQHALSEAAALLAAQHRTAARDLASRKQAVARQINELEAGLSSRIDQQQHQVRDLVMALTAQFGDDYRAFHEAGQRWLFEQVSADESFAAWLAPGVTSQQRAPKAAALIGLAQHWQALDRQMKQQQAQKILLNGELAGVLRHQEALLTAGQQARSKAQTLAAQWREQENAANAAFTDAQTAFDIALNESRTASTVAQALRRLAAVRLQLLDLEYRAGAQLLGLSEQIVPPGQSRVLRARLDEQLKELGDSAHRSSAVGSLWRQEALWLRVGSSIASWPKADRSTANGFTDTRQVKARPPLVDPGVVQSVLKSTLAKKSAGRVAVDGTVSRELALKSYAVLTLGDLEYPATGGAFLVRFPGAVLSLESFLYDTVARDGGD